MCRSSSILSFPGQSAGWWLPPLVAFAAVCAASAVWADGWHNASLSTSSLDQWLQDVKRAIPDLDQRLGTNTLQAGRGGEALKRAAEQTENKPGPENSRAAAPRRGPAGRLDARLTPQQQALLARKAGDCLEILAYMDPKNIFPQEFPNFPLGKISQYRTAAKQMLTAMGPAGGSAVAGHVRGLLTGAVRRQSDITFHASFQKDLMEVLRESIEQGSLSLEEIDGLNEAANGNKPPEVAAFAREVQVVLAQAGSLDMILNWLESSNNAAHKQKLQTQFIERMASADQRELLNAMRHPGASDRLRAAIVRRIEETLPEAGVLELLRLLQQDVNPNLNAVVARELSTRSPKYAEIQDDIDDLWKLARDDMRLAAAHARAQLDNAFARAPVTPCLNWLAKGDAGLNQIIWQNLELRIERADANRRAEYLQRGVQQFVDAQQTLAVRAQALEFLRRLQDRGAARPVAESLLTLPKELWTPAGKALAEWTGQDFGPRPGDMFAAVAAAAKKWHTWLQQNGQ